MGKGGSKGGQIQRLLFLLCVVNQIQRRRLQAGEAHVVGIGAGLAPGQYIAGFIAGPGRPVQRQGEGHVVLRLAGACHQGHGGDGDALVDDGNAELPLDGLAGDHQFFCLTADLFIDLPAGGLGVGVGAVQQGDAHGNGADVQVLLVDHVDGGEDVIGVDHNTAPLNAVHGVEDILTLGVDDQVPLSARGLQRGDQLGKGQVGVGGVHQHDHGEVVLQDSLADVQHIDVVFGQQGAYRGDDAHLVLADDGDDGSHTIRSFRFLWHGAVSAFLYCSSSRVRLNPGRKCSMK